LIEPGVQERRRESVIRARLEPVFSSGELNVVLQPIVSLIDGARVGAEALSRFPPEWSMAPNEVFAEATSIDIGIELELLAAQRAIDNLPRISGYLSINFSPKTLLDERCRELLTGTPSERIIIELSEHDPVHDYRALAAALSPLREGGVRLAIDDVGVGFSSLRHIVVSAPDLIKLDLSIVTGVATDHVLRTLARSLAEFGHEVGALVVAEGVETKEDAIALREAGVDFGQGWYFGRPGAPGQLVDSYQVG
jgi:EAL domain-containing protein (putative c-di-GMP-specific phosphodiesterase class I)